jgi:hypothetical protein
MLLKPDLGSLKRSCKLEGVGIAVVEKRVAPSHIKIPDSSPTWRYEVHLSKGHENKIICVCGTLVYLIVSPYSERDR